MNEPTEPSPAPFVAVADTLRARSDRAWLGEVWSRADLLWLFVATAAACCLRLWHLPQWSLSMAEAETWRGATESLRGADGFFASERCNYPLAFLMLRWLGDSGILPAHGEGWLRLPFAFFGILSVPLLALVGDLFVGRRAALIAAAFLAVHPWHVQASQTASGPVMAVFFVLMLSGFGSVAHRVRGRRLAVVAIASGLLAIGADPSAWLFVAAAAVIPALPGEPRPSPRRRLALGALLLLAVVVPAIVLLVTGRAVRPMAVPWGMFAGLADAFRPAALLMAVVGFAFAGATNASCWLACAACIPAGAVLVAAALGVPMTTAASLVALPFALLLAGSGAVRAWSLVTKALEVGEPRRLPWLPGSLFGLVCGLDLGVESYLYTTVRHGQRSEWRQAADVVRRETAQRPQFWVIADRGFEALIYYLRPNHWRDPHVDAHPGRNLLRPGAGGIGECTERARERARGDLFAVLTRAEFAALDTGQGEATQSGAFRVISVLPGASDAPDDTLYVLRYRTVE